MLGYSDNFPFLARLVQCDHCLRNISRLAIFLYLLSVVFFENWSIFVNFFFLTEMMIRRLFSNQRPVFKTFLNEYSAAILAAGVITSGVFAAGLYVNQMRIYEEMIKTAEEKADKNVKIAQEKIKIAQEMIKTAEERADKNVKIAQEMIKTAQAESERKYLQLLYNIFTQEEYKEAKAKLLAQKGSSSNVKNE
jgi:hypothetical protein